MFSKRRMILCWLLVMAALVAWGCTPTPPPLPDGSTKNDGGISSEVVSPDSVTNPEKGRPDTIGNTCKTNCDCPQTMGCSNGLCVSPTFPVYCCEKSGCEPGNPCLSQRGGKSICGAAGSSCNSACDCEAGLGCINGQCTKTASPVYCCERPKECPSGAKCEDKSGQSSTCGGSPQTCKTHCDCSQGESCSAGKCTAGPKPVYCCDKAGCPSGQACFQSDGLPGVCGNAGECKTDADCGGTTCRTSGVNPVCIQDKNTCFNGKCQKTSTNVPNARCDGNGVCQKLSSCQSHCDCPGTQACVNGQCSEVPGQPFWCCGDPACPPNANCYRSDNSKSVCGGQTGGCKTDSDCPPSTCSDSASECFETQYACDTTTGKCISNRLGFKDSICAQNQGKCTPRSAACKVDCDCPQGLSCVQGRCVASTAPAYCCTKSGCPAGNVCTDATGTSGTCGGVSSCAVNGDCGKPYCTQSNRDCILKTPTCTGGKCTETSATNTNMVCDAQTGLCKKGCFVDSDCQKATCKQSGKLCERTVGRCLGGQCQVSSSSDVGSCDAATGLCKPPATCQSHCDCAQGSFCYQGKCARSSYPVYCCDNPGCPSGATCYGTTSNTPSRCPVLCSSPCDCPEGQDCVTGKCVKKATPVYCCDTPSTCPAGAVCGDKSNNRSTCPAVSRPCKSACDCTQGEACTNGQCVKSATPVYCCEKESCPVGQGCISKQQLSGTCPQACNGHCDCPQGFNCISGKCTNDPAITSPTYCCSKAGCPTGQFCYHQDGRAARCPQAQCKSACDCAQGEDCRNGRCTPTSPPVYCCSKAGCPSGQACKDQTGSWGTCKASNTCQSACDCQQGEDCFNGQCVGVHPPVYCCSKTSCPSGQACVDSKGQRGFCPTTTCKTACDCNLQGQSCINGRCVIVTGAARVYCCNKQYCPAGQKCEDTQGNLKLCSKNSCQSPCDCNLGEDCRGGVCVNVNPPVYCCSASICPQNAACVKADGSQSFCGRP